MLDIALVRTNSTIYDPRVSKIVNSLKKKFSIICLGWNRDGIPVQQLTNKLPMKLEVFNLKSPHGTIRTIVYLPIFWFWTFFKLVGHKPKVVHACDVDTVIPCYFYKILFRKKLVYDVFDRVGMTWTGKLNSTFISFVNSLEERFIFKSDIFISVTEKVIQSFKKKLLNYIIIMNCKNDYNFKKKKSNKILRIVYAGGIMPGRGIEIISDAIQNLDGLEFVIAGNILEKKFLDNILKNKKIKYVGHLLPVEALALEASADVMFSLYDLTNPNYLLAGPNKFFEAMMLGLPCISNVALEIIDEFNCGVKVNYNNMNQIKSAIIHLRDDIEFRKEIGSNGRRAFELKYSWNNMEIKLYDIYNQLLNNPSKR